MALEIQLPTNKRDQGMLVACVAAIGLIVAYYMLLFQPKGVELDGLRARIDTLVAQNEVIRNEIARGNAAQLRAQAEEFSRMLVLFRQLVPVANEVPTLLDQISGAARASGLDIGGVDPQGVIPGEVYDTHRYRISVSGPYHAIAQFLNNIGSLTRIVAPMNLALNPSSRSSGNAVGPGERKLDATFEIQTYVAKIGLPAPSASPTGQ